MSTFPGESVEYREARDELLAAEAELRDRTEAVAAMRRALPLCDKVEQDYVFREGPTDLSADGPITEVRLSELFEDGKDELIVINLMFAKGAETSCPMCSAWADSRRLTVSTRSTRRPLRIRTRWRRRGCCRTLQCDTCSGVRWR